MKKWLDEYQNGGEEKDLTLDQYVPENRTYLSTWLAKRENQLANNIQDKYGRAPLPGEAREELGKQLQNLYNVPVATSPYEYGNKAIGLHNLPEGVSYFDELDKNKFERDLATENAINSYTNSYGFYQPFYNAVLIKPGLADSKYQLNSTILHELTHGLNYPSTQYRGYNRIVENPKGERIPQHHAIDRIIPDKQDDYYDSATEIYSRLMEFRKANKIDPSKTYTIEDVQKMRERKDNYFFDKIKDVNLFERYTDDQVLMLLNDVASNKGNSQKNSISAKNGRIIKDNKGYWNPDNWGKPVEINSNQITMKGVNQPLLGVSDTGDIQYMEPGREYMFEGKKVTEFPIAQNGTITALSPNYKSLFDNGVNYLKNKISERVYNSVKPSVYGNPDKNLDVLKNVITGKDRFDNAEYTNLSNKLREADEKGDIKRIKSLLSELENFNSDNIGRDDDYSEDGWLKYLGLNQSNNTFTESQYKPTKAKDPNSSYYRLPNEFEKELFNIHKESDFKLSNKIDESYFPSSMGENKSRARVLGNFTTDYGVDEKGSYISYYDKYDLSPELPYIGEVQVDKFIGNPFEIYNRIYYDPQTKEIIENKKNGGIIKTQPKKIYGDNNGSEISSKFSKLKSSNWLDYM